MMSHTAAEIAGPPAADFKLLTNHGQTLLLITHDPRARMRDIAALLNITERAAQRIVADLVTGRVRAPRARRKTQPLQRQDRAPTDPADPARHTGRIPARRPTAAARADRHRDALTRATQPSETRSTVRGLRPGAVGRPADLHRGQPAAGPHRHQAGSATLAFPGIRTAVLGQHGEEVEEGTGVLVVTRPWAGMLRTLAGGDAATWRRTGRAAARAPTWSGDAAPRDDDGLGGRGKAAEPGVRRRRQRPRRVLHRAAPDLQFDRVRPVALTATRAGRRREAPRARRRSRGNDSSIDSEQ